MVDLCVKFDLLWVIENPDREQYNGNYQQHYKCSDLCQELIADIYTLKKNQTPIGEQVGKMLQSTEEKYVMRRRIEMVLLRIYNVLSHYALDLFESALDSCWIQMVLRIGMLPEIGTERGKQM